MNNASEHDIDRILNAIRDTQPAEGLESRILQGIQHRTATRSGWFRWTLPMQWGVAALATAAVVLAVGLAVHNTHTTNPEIAQAPIPAPVHVTTDHSAPAAIHAAVPLPVPLRSTSAEYTPHKLLCDCDQLAMDEMEAPSHPAPTMPLTAQERLLQRVVHQNDSFELAELEPPPNALRRAVVPAKEDDAVKSVVQHYLKQLAAAEALNPTPPTPEPAPEPEDPQPNTDSDTPN